nr:kinesin-like protein KIF19 [Cherax quadricarinatus]
MGQKKAEEKKDQREELSSSERLNVAVRVRPLTSEERNKGCYRIIQAIDTKMLMLQEQETGKSDHLRLNRKSDKQFVFDRLFSEESNQDELYKDTTKVLVEDVLKGFHATVFAYGATGAGKTFTMVGTTEQPGIMVRALNDLFNTLDSERNSKAKISMSYLEIYNENIRDLLQPGGSLELREDAKTGVIQVANLTEKAIINTKEVMKLLTKGNKERTCEPTAANKTSSRSHALLQVNVRRSDLKGECEEVKNGRLFMVDLAGSERAQQTQNKGKRLQEGAHINRSLLALGNCINALAEGRAKYVNYRDSKLTRLLKDALSGNCRTVMIAHVSPCHLHREETRNTLIYADRAKNISKQVWDRTGQLEMGWRSENRRTVEGETRSMVKEVRRSDVLKESGRTLVLAAGDETAPADVLLLSYVLIKCFLMIVIIITLNRNKLMDIDSSILALSMEFERQNLVVTEWEAERSRRSKGRSDSVKGPDGEDIIDMDTDKEKDDDSDDDEPEEVTQAWEDLMYLQKEQQRYTEMREKVEQEMTEVKKRANKMEELLEKRIRCRKRLNRCRKLLRKWHEALPKSITNDEQRELLNLLCKVHELEIQKVEMQSEALLKEHELRRRDLVIMRYDRQRSLCDEIITRQRQMLEAIHDGHETKTTMSPELQELYALYQMELQYTTNQRDGIYTSDANHMFRLPVLVDSYQ